MEKKKYNSNNANKGANEQHRTSRRPRISESGNPIRRSVRRDDDATPYYSTTNADDGGRERRPNRFTDTSRSGEGENKPTGRRNHHGKSHAARRPGQHANETKSNANKEAKPQEPKNGATKVKREKRHPLPPKPKTPPPTPKPYDGTTRLNKYIANAGICSRREADKLIAAGTVMVNGKVVTEMGYQVHEGDVVNYGGETLHSERKRYFLLNKPKGFITTVDDPQERETVMMLIDGACSERIYPVGRLDRNTTGLLLFTNDGDLARRLTHPSTGVYKIYQVELDRPVTREDMRQMLEGIELEDGPIHVDDVQYVQTANDKRVVGVELHSGKNRIVRRIFEHFGYNVHKLDRVVFAGLTKKDLPRGRYRELTEKEVGYLKMI